ncbi:MAG: hypothetical protein ABI091_25800 [Ferruginibacter sp.]
MEQYRVSMYIDEIRKVNVKNNDFYKHVLRNNFYLYFDTYLDAKEYLVERHKTKIFEMEKELNKLKKKLPKLLNIIEKSY